MTASRNQVIFYRRRAAISRRRRGKDYRSCFATAWKKPRSRSGDNVEKRIFIEEPTLADVLCCEIYGQNHENMYLMSDIVGKNRGRHSQNQGRPEVECRLPQASQRPYAPTTDNR